MARFWPGFFLVLFATMTSPGSAADENMARLVTFDELQKRLGDPELRLLDVRPKAEYDQGHVPGAIWVDAKAVESMAAKPGALTDRPSWEKWITPLGLGQNTEVVIYDARRQLDAARLWWLLSYLGVERVGLLDGGFPLWATEKRPITTDVPAIRPVPFSVSFRTARHATRADVLSALGSRSEVVIDARSDAEYAGEDKRAKRAGHIPSACSLEWANLVRPDGRFLDDSTLRAKLTKVGVRHDQSVITHCQSGGRASVNTFVLERLGFRTRNYYLGWSDWGNAGETPVEVANGRQPKQ
jgi:thiosulfate/3-mercaptopyruvate sulfurtransferase